MVIKRTGLEIPALVIQSFEPSVEHKLSLNMTILLKSNSAFSGSMSSSVPLNQYIQACIVAVGCGGILLTFFHASHE
jgi:hypothetical protein